MRGVLLCVNAFHSLSKFRWCTHGTALLQGSVRTHPRRVLKTLKLTLIIRGAKNVVPEVMTASFVPLPECNLVAIKIHEFDFYLVPNLYSIYYTDLYTSNFPGASYTVHEISHVSTTQLQTQSQLGKHLPIVSVIFVCRYNTS